MRGRPLAERPAHFGVFRLDDTSGLEDAPGLHRFSERSLRHEPRAEERRDRPARVFPGSGPDDPDDGVARRLAHQLDAVLGHPPEAAVRRAEPDASRLSGPNCRASTS